MIHELPLDLIPAELTGRTAGVVIFYSIIYLRIFGKQGQGVYPFLQASDLPQMSADIYTQIDFKQGQQALKYGSCIIPLKLLS